MSRRSTTPSVTLFPFLAVLVCAMGALILLLLVTTRRIRQQEMLKWSQAAAVVEPAAVIPEAVAIPEPVASVAAIPESETAFAVSAPEPMDAGPPLLPELDDDYEERLAARLREIETLRIRHWQALRDRDDQEAELRTRYERRIAALATEERRLLAEQAAVQSQSAELLDGLAELERQHRDVRELAARTEEQAGTLNDGLLAVQQRKETLSAEHRTLKAAVERGGTARKAEKPKFEIVAYDGASGTNRRPILIECRADGLTFAAERIALSPEQLNGFPPEKNPIRSGTEALLEYWKIQDVSAAGKSPAPYVLLIVRPGGTVGFYVARKLLEQLDHEYGYELVSAPEDILWPEPDAGAVAACRNAVDAVLSERDRIAGRTRTGKLPIAQEHEYSGGDGRFHLPEIDQMQQRKGNPLLGSPTWMPRRPIKNQYETASTAEGDAAPFPIRSTPVPDLKSTGGATFVPPPPGPGASSKFPASNGQPPTFAEIHDLRQAPRSVSEGTETPRGAAEGVPGPLGTENVTADLNLPSPSQEPLPANPFASVAPADRKAGGRPLPGRPQQEGIGIERETVVHLRAERVEVEEVDDALSGPLDKAALHAGLTQLLATHAASWGAAPAPFFWKPTLKIVVHPGGNQHWPRVQELAESWQVETRRELSLD